MYYLAGPMSGLPHFNYPDFIDAAENLRKKGFEIHNPAESRLGLGYDRLTYLKEDFQFIISDECEGIFTLPAWTESSGARAEVHLARSLGKPIRGAYTLHQRSDDYFERVFAKSFTQFNETAVPLQVAINGKMRSGKDTVARELQHWTQVPIDRFAGPLKEGCEKFGCGDGEIVKDRIALQDIGQYFVARNPRWWVNLLDDRTINRADTGLIIPDLRSLEEFNWCKENDIITVRIEVDEETQVARGAEAERMNHVTETGLDEVREQFDILFEADTPVDLMVNIILGETGTQERLERFKQFNQERMQTVG